MNNKGNHQQKVKTTYQWDKIFANYITDNELIYIKNIYMSQNV